MPPSQAPQNNPYDFITGSGQPAPSGSGKLPLMPKANSSMVRRIIIVGVGVFVLIIVTLIVSSALSSVGKAGLNQLLAVANDQAALTTLATQGATGAVNQDTKNLALTTELTMTTTQSKFLALIKTEGLSIASTQIKPNITTDTTQLTQATQVSNFDPVFIQIITAELNQYRTDLQTAYKGTTIAARKQFLSKSYTAAALLLQQANTANTALNT
jgi:hypothetical protein